MINAYEHGSSHPINKTFPIGIIGSNERLSLIDGKLILDYPQPIKPSELSDDAKAFLNQIPDTEEVPTLEQIRMGYDTHSHVFDGTMVKEFNKFLKKNKGKLNRIYKDNSIVDYFMQIIYPNDTVFCKLRGYRKYLPWTERLYLWLHEHRSISIINKILVRYERKQSKIVRDNNKKSYNDLAHKFDIRFDNIDLSNITLAITETGGIYYDESTKSYILIDDEIKEYQQRDEGNTGESLIGYEKEVSYQWTMTK